MQTQTTIRSKLSNYRNVTVGILTEKREQEQRDMARNARNTALWLRDEAILRIRELSYSRNGKLVPRKKEWRENLNAACAAARVYATLARPDNGYPKNPVTRDPEFPTLDTKGVSYHEAERNRLRKWLAILAERCDDLETEFMMIRVEEHIDWLSARIERAQSKAIEEKIGERDFRIRGRLIIVENAR